jgi:hypothetical protein
MNSTENKRGEIAVWMVGWIARRLGPFVKEAAERGFDVSVICSTKVDQKIVLREHKGLVKEVISISEVFDRFWEERTKLQIDKAVEKAIRNEKHYQCPVVDLIRADRHMGRGFVKGGWFPRSLLSEKVGYYDYLDLMNRMLDFLDSFFSRHNFSVLMTEVASFPTKAACLVARSRGVAIRNPHPSRIEDFYFFSHDEFVGFPPLEQDYRRALQNADPGDSERLPRQQDESYGLARTEIGGYLEYRSLWRTIRGIAQQLLVQAYRKLRRYTVYSPYYVRDRVKAVWLYHRGIRQFDRKRFPKRDEYAGRDYVFYPLQLEPESAMMVMSPEFGHQEYLIHVLASSLPAGWTLVAKEHPLALGTRPPGFYERIEAYPNVVLANPFDGAMEWYAGSRAVAMITGSVGYEAALRGIPVISFGQHNFIRVLDHVFVVDSHESVRNALLCIHKQGMQDETVRRHQGWVLRQALIERSFRLNGRVSSGRKGDQEGREVAHFADKLIESLGTGKVDPLPR